MIDRDDVFNAYRMFFGREPESDAAIAQCTTEIQDLDALRALFINSIEFRNSLEKYQPPRMPRLGFNGPPMSIEILADEVKLAELFAKVSAQWSHLGETEPHWSVITNDSYYQENFHMNREAFYSSGYAEVQMFDATLKRANVSSDNLNRCVELGCGVGRVTGPLAERFNKVIGVDISPAHLLVAKDYFSATDHDNIEWVHLDSIELVSDLGVFDLLYSRIVLQHNPPPVMHRILRDLLDLLRPGGIAFFQIPTYKAGYSFSIDGYLARPNVTDMEMHYLPQGHLLRLIKECDCEVLEIREDDSTGLSVTAVSNTLLVQKVIH